MESMRRQSVSAIGKWVALANEGLRLTYREAAAAGLAAPEALDVREHIDNLIVAESISKGGHTTLEVRHARALLYPSTLANHPVQETVRVVPGVTFAVQGRRRKRAVLLGNMPVGLALTGVTVAGGAGGGEDILACSRSRGRGDPVVWSGVGIVRGGRAGCEFQARATPTPGLPRASQSSHQWSK